MPAPAGIADASHPSSAGPRDASSPGITPDRQVADAGHLGQQLHRDWGRPPSSRTTLASRVDSGACRLAGT